MAPDDIPGAVLWEAGGVGDVDCAEGALGELPAEAEAGAGQRGHHVRLEAAPHRAQGVRILDEAATGVLEKFVIFSLNLLTKKTPKYSSEYANLPNMVKKR